jgi:hypothetical protein
VVPVYLTAIRAGAGRAHQGEEAHRIGRDRCAEVAARCASGAEGRIGEEERLVHEEERIDHHGIARVAVVDGDACGARVGHERRRQARTLRVHHEQPGVADGRVVAVEHHAAIHVAGTRAFERDVEHERAFACRTRG